MKEQRSCPPDLRACSALATITVPILTPIAHLSGVSGQVTVTALLVGSGLTNMISPANGLLLAFLAASRVNYVEWARFVAPLVAIYFVMGLLSPYVMASLNY